MRSRRLRRISMHDRTLVVLHEGLCSRVRRHYTLGHLGPCMLYIAFNRSENIHIMPPARLWNVLNVYSTVAIKLRENRRGYLLIDNPQILATLDTQDTARRQTKQKTQQRNLKRWTTRDPPNTRGWIQVLKNISCYCLL